MAATWRFATSWIKLESAATFRILAALVLHQQDQQMDRQLTTWKALADRFWQADAPDYREAAQLTAEIATATAGDDALRHAAMQALPSLRNALSKRADRGARDLAARRFSVVRDRLHALTAPRFGKRGGETGPLTPQDRNRQMLGLPLDRPVSAPEIQQAYKRVAKTLHPDGGGNARDFVGLLEARDALMKER
jgi:hypothetical protein